MAKAIKKPKMTLDKLAGMTAREFLAVGDKIDKIHEDMATKDDLKELGQKIVINFATKDDLKQFATKEDIKAGEVRILQAVDKIATSFDKAEKDHAADKMLHDRHEKRIEKLEVRVGMR